MSNQVAEIGDANRAHDSALAVSAALRITLENETSRLNKDVTDLNVVRHADIAKHHDDLATMRAELEERNLTIGVLRADLTKLRMEFTEQDQLLCKTQLDAKHYHRKCSQALAKLLDLESSSGDPSNQPSRGATGTAQSRSNSPAGGSGGYLGVHPQSNYFAGILPELP